MRSSCPNRFIRPLITWTPWSSQSDIERYERWRRRFHSQALSTRRGSVGVEEVDAPDSVMRVAEQGLRSRTGRDRAVHGQPPEPSVGGRRNSRAMEVRIAGPGRGVHPTDGAWTEGAPIAVPADLHIPAFFMRMDAHQCNSAGHGQGPTPGCSPRTPARAGTVMGSRTGQGGRCCTGPIPRWGSTCSACFTRVPVTSSKKSHVDVVGPQDQGFLTVLCC